jgi:beta-lactamase regulating signal transducer with metallopeptidase domain
MIDNLFVGNPWPLLLVEGTVCLAAGLAASYALRHRPAHAHQVLLTALLAAVLMPGLYLSARHFGFGVLAPRAASPVWEIVEPQPFDTALAPDKVTMEGSHEPTPAPGVEPIPAYRATTRCIPWIAVAIGCWLTATVVLLTRLALRFLLGLRLLRAADPLGTEPVGHALEEAKRRLGIERSVRIRCSKKVRSPVIWCWVREPVLLMQKAAVNRREGIDWVGVFCHELAHWRRRDHLSGLFAELLVAVFPWHPLLWWTKGRLLTFSEQACDDWVLATGHRGEDYAETLLGLAAQRQMAFLPTIIGREKTMNMRIRRIIKDGGSNPRIGTRCALGITLAAILASVGVALAQQAPVPPQPVEPAPTQTPALPSNPQAAPVPEEARQRKVLDLQIELVTTLFREKEALLRELSHLPLEKEWLESQISWLRGHIQQLEWERENPGRPDQNPFTAQMAILHERLTPPPNDPAKTESTQPRPDLEEPLPRLLARAGELRAELRARPDMRPEIAEALRQEIKQLDARTWERQEQLRARITAAEQELRTSEDVAASREPAATPQRTRRVSTGTQGPIRAEVRVYTLEHIHPEKMKALVEALIEKPESITIFADGAKAAVYATLENHQRLQRIIRVIDVPEDGPNLAPGEHRVEEVKIIALKYFRARQMQDILRAMVGETGYAVADEQRHCLNVRTTRANMKRVESVVRELDIPADDRVFETEVEELRNQMRQLNVQMQQMRNRLDQSAERNRQSESNEQPSGGQAERR